MKTTGLDGNEYKVKLTKKAINDNFKSAGHKQCRIILKQLYPSDNIFEEITIWPGLIVDFILPLRRLIIEVNGVQHSKFVPFFHGNLGKFNGQKNRDRAKLEWSKMNNFTFVALDDKEVDVWKEKILGAFNG